MSEPDGFTLASPSQSITHIEDRVYSALALQAALSIPGVIGHASGITRFTGRRLPRSGIRWDALHTSVSVDLQIAITWPTPVVDMARVVQETVRHWIGDFTGTPVVSVNVDIEAIVPAPETQPPVNSAALDAAPRAPQLNPISITPLSVSSPTIERKTSLRPIRARRPTIPSPIPVPSPPHLIPVRTVPRTAVQSVDTPDRTPMTTPRVPMRHSLHEIEVRHHVVVDHSEQHRDFSAKIQVKHDIPTPRGPQLENIPTPQGLPVRTVPTPRGVELTIFPHISRQGLRPITVRRHPRISVSLPQDSRKTSPGEDITGGK